MYQTLHHQITSINTKLIEAHLIALLLFDYTPLCILNPPTPTLTYLHFASCYPTIKKLAVPIDTLKTYSHTTNLETTLSICYRITWIRLNLSPVANSSPSMRNQKLQMSPHLYMYTHITSKTHRLRTFSKRIGPHSSLIPISKVFQTDVLCLVTIC